MSIHIFKTVQEQIKAMADYFVTVAQESIALRGEFNVVLSGGSSPQKLYELLASPAYKQKVDWEKVNFFFGDERYVPANDPENNALMVKRALFDPLNISASKIFSVDTSLSPSDAAKTYAETIINYFKVQEARFDLILLGLGDNSHTASLFPDTPVLSEKSASVKEVFLKQQNVYRITMTAPLINQARHIAFLVYGEAKAKAVKHVLEDEPNPYRYPAQLIHEAQWFMDELAASGLKKE
jgi:6-phosphogluconolactonase